MNILLTGGTGYIGSHTAVAMIEAGHEVVIADNLINSSREVIRRIEMITEHAPVFYEIDVCDRDALAVVFSENQIDAVVHLAGLKAVGESVDQPLRYYRNNIDGTLSLLECMVEHGVRNLVFSSSATVYGAENPYPYIETMRKGACASPYGWTKSMIEQILTDAAVADTSLSIVLLRYFNPIGAHESGLIGEAPTGYPNNLMPFILDVAAGKREQLTVFGGDYDTPDGTCRRDYLHVMDLAEGHVKAAAYAAKRSALVGTESNTEVFNLGTGIPYSVLEIVTAFEKNSGISLPYKIGARREGDLPEYWADASKAEQLLGWKARRGLDEMCRDSWYWLSKNPDGYVK